MIIPPDVKVQVIKGQSPVDPLKTYQRVIVAFEDDGKERCFMSPIVESEIGVASQPITPLFSMMENWFNKEVLPEIEKRKR